MFNVNYSTYDEKNNKIVNILVSIKAEQQSRIDKNLYPAYNEFQKKLMEMIDRILEYLRQFNEYCPIDKLIIDELQREKYIVLHKKKKALYRFEMLKHRLHEECIDYLLYIIGNIK